MVEVATKEPESCEEEAAHHIKEIAKFLFGVRNSKSLFMCSFSIQSTFTDSSVNFLCFKTGRILPIMIMLSWSAAISNDTARTARSG
ncbi:MAG: hypothetical protein ACJ701_07785 [Nitrososphaera sp.]